MRKLPKGPKLTAWEEEHVQDEGVGVWWQWPQVAGADCGRTLCTRVAKRARTAARALRTVMARPGPVPVRTKLGL
jgi:hypothetical protein